MNMHEKGHLYKKHTKIGSPNSLGSCLGTQNQTKCENRNMNKRVTYTRNIQKLGHQTV